MEMCIRDRVVGIVNGRTVNDFAVFSHRQIVCNGNRFGMSDEKATVGTFHRCPAAHLRGRAGLVQIDGGLATEAVGTSIFRPVFFMRSPAEFGRLEEMCIRDRWCPVRRIPATGSWRDRFP